MISTHSMDFKANSYFFSISFYIENNKQLTFTNSRPFKLAAWKGLQKCDSSNCQFYKCEDQQYLTSQLAFNIPNYDEKRDVLINILMYETIKFKDCQIARTSISTSKYIQQFYIRDNKVFKQKLDFGSGFIAKLFIFVNSSKEKLIKSIQSFEKDFQFLSINASNQEVKERTLDNQLISPSKKHNYNRQCLINYRCDSLNTITQQQSCFQTQLKLKSQQSAEQIKDFGEAPIRKSHLNRAYTMLKIFDQEFGEDFKQHNSQSNHSIDSMFKIELQKQKNQQEQEFKRQIEMTNNINYFQKQNSQVYTKPSTIISQQFQNQDNQNQDTSSLNVSVSWLLIPEPQKKTYKTKYCIFFLVIILIAVFIINVQPVSKHLLSPHKANKKSNKDLKQKKLHQSHKKSFRKKRQSKTQQE